MRQTEKNATWETLYPSGHFAISRHVRKYATKPLPNPYQSATRREDRTDCEHLEAVPFKAHCYCNGFSYTKLVHPADCLRCRKYSPKSPR